MCVMEVSSYVQCSSPTVSLLQPEKCASLGVIAIAARQASHFQGLPTVSDTERQSTESTSCFPSIPGRLARSLHNRGPSFYLRGPRVGCHTPTRFPVECPHILPPESPSSVVLGTWIIVLAFAFRPHDPRVSVLFKRIWLGSRWPTEGFYFPSGPELRDVYAVAKSILQSAHKRLASMDDPRIETKHSEVLESKPGTLDEGECWAPLRMGTVGHGPDTVAFSGSLAAGQ
ncbi:hypothetical protein L209DRAFT_504308 [Thermothelomyces heterothallicus CBS 203.75]